MMIMMNLDKLRVHLLEKMVTYTQHLISKMQIK